MILSSHAVDFNRDFNLVGKRHEKWVSIMTLVSPLSKLSFLTK